MPPAAQLATMAPYLPARAQALQTRVLVVQLGKRQYWVAPSNVYLEGLVSERRSMPSYRPRPEGCLVGGAVPILLLCNISGIACGGAERDSRATSLMLPTLDIASEQYVQVLKVNKRKQHATGT